MTATHGVFARIVRWIGGLAVVLSVHSASAGARGADTLTVVTLNLWHDQHEWPKRLGGDAPVRWTGEHCG